MSQSFASLFVVLQLTNFEEIVFLLVLQVGKKFFFCKVDGAVVIGVLSIQVYVFNVSGSVSQPVQLRCPQILHDQF